MPGHYHTPPTPPPLAPKPRKPKAPKNSFDEQNTRDAAGRGLDKKPKYQQKKRPTHYADGLDTGPQIN